MKSDRPLSWIAPEIRAQRGLQWCAAWFGLNAVAALLFAVFTEGLAGLLFLFLLAGLHAYACVGLLRGLKSGWHIAAFLAFATIVVQSISVACAPGNMARGDMHFFELVLNVLILAVAVLVFGYLRAPAIRRLYGVPENYRVAESDPE
jgi:hypothetical protein